MWIVETMHIRDEDGQTVAAELRDTDGFIRAHVRWDGGMQIWIDNVSEEQSQFCDTFHTYDLRGIISKLHDLNDASEALFDGQGYWAPDANQDENDLAYTPDETVRGGATPPP